VDTFLTKLEGLTKMEDQQSAIAAILPRYVRAAAFPRQKNADHA
jgi:hypothetical protein